MHFDPSFPAPSGAFLFLQRPQTAQPFQDPCLDRDTAVHQTAPAFLALQHHPHSSWGSTVGFLEPTENLKDHTINSQKSAPITSEPHFNENPTKSAVLAVMKNQPAVEQLLNRAGQSSGGSAGAAAAPQRQQQQWAAGVICSAWRSWHHLARLRSALGAARRRHLENFHSRAKVCAAGSCCCTAAFPNISCLAASKKLLPFFPPLYLSACPRIIFHPSSAIQPLWLQNLSQCFCWKRPFSLASVLLAENQCFNCITLVPYIYLVALNLLQKKKKSLSCLHCCHHFVRKYLSLQTAS